jgi:hypothetical protein
MHKNLYLDLNYGYILAHIIAMRYELHALRAYRHNAAQMGGQISVAFWLSQRPTGVIAADC